MRAIVQRVSRAQVRSGGNDRGAGKVLGQIGRGFVVLLGVAAGDTEADAQFIADRTLKMRVFADAAGKMNLALDAPEVGGALLVVSQFTLLADTGAGRRPSFTGAAAPDDARRLYEYFLSLIRARDVKLETGEFGTAMQLELVNDGPVTIILDSRDRK
ncbi:MAG TPA: D-aminoacyl-tRNA deacylase [Candidatus Binataceae bacterium]|nr:D-aminoacyl-tRNA deacylase [Candidatus Binataceae bacterium]